MRYLLDVNALIAAIITAHPRHARADRWLLLAELASRHKMKLATLDANISDAAAVLIV